MTPLLDRARPAALVVLLAGSQFACVALTDPAEDALAVTGSWSYSALQLAPQLEMQGAFEVRSQRGADISGSASWEEQDAMGAVRLDGGPVSGRVIGTGDIDFDVETTAGVRRHVARFVTPDSMVGVWILTETSRSGEFVAVRSRL